MFLGLLRQVGNIRKVCRRMKISHNSPYKWARKDDAFAERFAEARAEGEEVVADALEAALDERAIVGCDEGVFYKGKKVASRRVYSDVAAIFRLKGLRPHKYMEQLVGVNVQGQQMVVKILNFSSALPPPNPPGLGAGDASSAPERPGSLNGSATPELMEESPR